MSQVLNKWILTVACATLLGVCMPLIASAGSINIILSDVDVTYAGAAAGGTGSIYDIIAHPGGTKNPAESDGVASAVFEVDMAQVATLMTGGGTNLYADLKIDGVGATVPLGGLNNVGNNGGNFGLDFFTNTGVALHLGINKIDLLLTNGVLFFTGQASNVTSANLPGGLAFDTTQPIYFSYTATLPGIVGSPATMAVASGAMTISGTMIPEPATAGLFVLGAVLAVCPIARRNRTT
jgi:hypothetical protein